MNLFEKLLYGMKVINDNLLTINEKIEEMTKTMNYSSTDSGNDINIESIRHE